MNEYPRLGIQPEVQQALIEIARLCSRVDRGPVGDSLESLQAEHSKLRHSNLTPMKSKRLLSTIKISNRPKEPQKILANSTTQVNENFGFDFVGQKLKNFRVRSFSLAVWRRENIAIKVSRGVESAMVN